MHETIADNSQEDVLISAGMLADRLRPLVLASCDRGETGTSCMGNGPFIPIHRATLGAIYQHLEDKAAWDGERTILALECELRGLEENRSERMAEARARLAERRKMAAEPIDALPKGEA